MAEPGPRGGEGWLHSFPSQAFPSNLSATQDPECSAGTHLEKLIRRGQGGSYILRGLEIGEMLDGAGKLLFAREVGFLQAEMSPDWESPVQIRVSEPGQPQTDP